LKPIIFPDYISVESIEQMINNFYTESKLSSNKTITFDFSKTKWICFYAASLILSWILFLLDEKQKQINIELPEEHEISKQVKKVLINYGILSILKNKGANVDYYLAERDSGFPIYLFDNKSFKDYQAVWEKTESLRESFIINNYLKTFEKQILEDVFDVIVQELIENALNHGNRNNIYFGMNISTSYSKTSNQEYLTQQYDKNTKYVEIIIGDLGKGIVKTIKPNYQEDYKIPFNCDVKTLNKSDKIAAYAFDFFSTSDEESREKRIRDTLSEKSNIISSKIHANDIATGLFCVLKEVQEKKGQIILRNPESLISINYYSKLIPKGILHNLKKTKIQKLLQIPGAHFIIRIPLIEKFKIQTSYIQKPSSKQIIDFNNVNFISAFEENIKHPTSKLIDKALNEINKSIKSKANSEEGIIFIPSPPVDLKSRDMAVFIAGLQLISNDSLLFIWNFRIAQNIFNDISSIYPNNELPGVFFGNIYENTFSSVGKKTKLIDDWFLPKSNNAQLRSLDIDVIQEIFKQQLKSLKREIIRKITKKDVLHNNGLYLIEKKYYTEKFYQITSLLDDFHFSKLCAEWICNTIIISELKFNNIVVISRSVSEIAHQLKSLLSYSNFEINIINVSDLKTYDEIKKETKNISKQKSLIITNVICRGETIKRFVEPLSYRLDIEKIITIVDARIELLDLLGINILSIHKDPIKYYKDNDDIPKKIQNKEIYLIDEKTIAPTLRIRPINKKFRAIDTSIETFRSINKSNSLLSRHIEFKGNHFNLFFNLNKFFQSMELQIKNKIRNLINNINEKDKNTIIKTFFYDPNDDLLFLQDLILFDFNSPQKITLNELFAPEIPELESNTNLKCLIIIPASINGKIARLAIEYISRLHPKEIYFHSILSRMRPRDQAFLQSITTYNNIKLFVSFSLEVRIPAFGKHNCPICLESAKYKNILNNLHSNGHQMNEEEIDIIDKLVSKKIEKLDVLDMNKPENYNSDYNTTEDIVRKMEIRSLYESSEYNIESRRKLSKVLNNSNALYLFSEIVNEEFLSDEFTPDIIRMRLYNDFEKLISKLMEILEQNNGEVNISKHLNTLMHLIPNETNFKISFLFSKYSNSLNIIEEICLSLLLKNKIFNYEQNIFHNSKIVDNVTTKRILKTIESTESYIQSKKQLSNYNIKEDKATIEPFIDLFASLIRSERLFRDRTKELSSKPILSKDDIESLTSIDSDWSEFFKIINKLRTSVIGNNLLNRYTIYNEIFYKLSKLVKEIRKQALLYEKNRDISEFSLLILQSFEQIKNEIEKLKKQNSMLRFSPSDFYNIMGCKLITKKGKEIEIINLPKENNERRKLPSWVFGEKKHFLNIFNGIKNNWSKHCEEIKSPVIFKISEQNHSVHFEFIDSCKGKINKNSKGTIEQIKKYCETYGCKLDINNHFEFDSIECHCVRISMIVFEDLGGE
jgi:hypothetical protein